MANRLVVDGEVGLHNYQSKKAQNKQPGAVAPGKEGLNKNNAED